MRLVLQASNGNHPVRTVHTARRAPGPLSAALLCAAQWGTAQAAGKERRRASTQHSARHSAPHSTAHRHSARKRDPL